MTDEKLVSKLKLERLSFEEITYSRDLNAAVIPEYEMNFTRQVSAHEDQKHFRVSLTANVWTKDADTIKVKVTIVGVFFCDCEDEWIKSELINKNSLSILFPYLRSQISLVTTQPDMPPITIQPINIVGLFGEADSQDK